MKASPLVAQSMMKETEAHMTNLVQGIRTIAAAAAASSNATPAAATDAAMASADVATCAAVKHKAVATGVHRRVRGKTLTDMTTYTEG
eukprot:4543637-Karenia_brevis.AAC.1